MRSQQLERQTIPRVAAGPGGGHEFRRVKVVEESGGPPGWSAVRKRRRISRFSLASGPIEARAPGQGQEPRCEVELTEVRVRGQDWWTLGFEATGF
jgi:hypothetical protein